MAIQRTREQWERIAELILKEGLTREQAERYVDTVPQGPEAPPQEPPQLTGPLPWRAPPQRPGAQPTTQPATQPAAPLSSAASAIRPTLPGGLPSDLPGAEERSDPSLPVGEKVGLLERLGRRPAAVLQGPLGTPDRKLKALEILGTLGAAYFGSRDAAAAGKRTAQSQARANLTNALSRRARSQGTVSEPRMGLGSTLMNSLAMAGRGGQEALQQERGQAQQTFERERALAGESLDLREQTRREEETRQSGQQQAFERTQTEKKTGQAERGLDLEEQRGKWQHENDQVRNEIDRETNEIRRMQATAQATKGVAGKPLPKDVADNLGKLMSTAQSLRAFRKQLKDYFWTGPIGGRAGALLPQIMGGDVRRSLEQKANLLAYELAAIEGQTNRSLSDMDRKMFAEALTGMTDFDSTQDLKLDTLDTLLQQHVLGMTKIYQASGYDPKPFLVILDELSGTGVQAGQEESGGEELDEEERQAIQDYADEQGLTFEEARAELDRMMEEEE